MSALSYYSRFLLADPRYGYQKLVNKKKDTLMPQSFDVFDEQTGAYDKRVRDVEPIGSTADYLNTYRWLQSARFARKTVLISLC